MCPLTALQKDVYKSLLNLEQVKIILTADDPCPCGSVDEKNERYKRGSCCDQKWTKVRPCAVRPALQAEADWISYAAHLQVHHALRQGQQPSRTDLPRFVRLLGRSLAELTILYRTDKEDKTTNPTKYEQDLEWARAAFPNDYEKRTPGPMAFLDPNLCGKWTVRRSLAGITELAT